jgi:myo-inositol-1(or 4)-monophosphatase
LGIENSFPSAIKGVMKVKIARIALIQFRIDNQFTGARDFVNQFLQKATEIALEAGSILQSFWGKLTQVRSKEYYWDLVTEADLASEAYILEALRKSYPSHLILSEEAGVISPSGEAAYQWLVDPLDGTTNFTHQYPMVSVSIGLVKEGIPIVGVVYNPILKELFAAEQGKGVTLNGEKLHVSKVDSIERSLLATGFAYDRKDTQENNYAEFCRMTQSSQGVRRAGSAALDLAYVAAGRLDGYWERGLRAWDTAAGVILVREAGGTVTSYENGPFDLFSGRILATNGLIHSILSRELLAAAR